MRSRAGDIRKAIDGYSQAEGDEVARMVLQLVQGIDRERHRRRAPLERVGPSATSHELETLLRAGPSTDDHSTDRISDPPRAHDLRATDPQANPRTIRATTPRSPEVA